MALPFRRKAVSTDTLPAPEQLPKHIGFIMDGNGTCGDYFRWEWTLGEEAFYAEKLWTFTGSEDSRTDL